MAPQTTSVLVSLGFVLLQTVLSDCKCLLLEAKPSESVLQSPGYPDGYANNLSLCWLLRSESKGERVQLEVKRSFVQPRKVNGEWTDYLLVADGLCSGDARVVRRWAGTDVPDRITSSGRELCLRFYSDESIRERGFIIAYKNTGEAGLSVSVVITVILVVIVVSTVVIVGVVMYILCRRRRRARIGSTQPDDSIPHDAFPPSYSVAVREHNSTRLPLDTVSGAVDGSASSEENINRQENGNILAPVVQPPSYSRGLDLDEPPTPPPDAPSRREPHPQPSLHRSPPGEYTIPGMEQPFQPF